MSIEMQDTKKETHHDLEPQDLSQAEETPTVTEEPQESDHKGALEAEVASLKDKLLRAMAEIENTKRRYQREVEDMSKYAISNFARDLLSASDNLRRALESIPAEEKEASSFLKTLVEGVELTEKDLLKAFEKYKIERIVPMGEKFDHNFHQAMFEVESDEHPSGTIVNVMQVGYKIHDRLLRPALVGVSKGKKA